MRLPASLLLFASLACAQSDNALVALGKALLFDTLALAAFLRALTGTVRDGRQ